jgi:hypothetical protein
MTTPLWVPLVVAALGLVSTVVGIVVTQIMANRRERQSWQRETDRERERWAREDQARTFEHRRAAYVEFYDSLRKTGLRIHENGYGLSDEGTELPFGWQTDMWEKLQHLELYASPRVALLAHETYDATYRWGDKARHDRLDGTYFENEEASDDAKGTLLEAIRADLRVPSNKPLALDEAESAD